MKNSLLLIVLALLTTLISSAQVASEYYPMNIGNYWIMRCDTFFGEYHPTIFRQDVEGIDTILEEEYFRIKHTNINGINWSSYFWLLTDSTGIVIKAQCNTSSVDSATKYDTSLLWMPNKMLNVGFSWEWDTPLLGFMYAYSVESISENVQVPVGDFNNCILIRTVITDTLGNSLSEYDAYFARGIGEVLMIDSRLGRFELIGYSLQNTIDCYDTIHLYDTIPVYDTVPVIDTIPVLDTIPIYDTIQIYDSIAVTDTLIIDVTFTTEESAVFLNTIRIYPNPAKNTIYIHTGENYANLSDYIIKIVSTQGQTIFESNISQQIFEIDIGSFGQTGLYIIQITNDSHQIIERRKIILE